ncbi:MAG: PAS domain S-box protein [Cyanophyceae cyanobacterium]
MFLKSSPLELKKAPSSAGISLTAILSLASVAISISSVALVSSLQIWLDYQTQKRLVRQQQLTIAVEVASEVEHTFEQAINVVKAKALTEQPLTESASRRQLMLKHLLHLEANFEEVALLDSRGQELNKVSRSREQESVNLHNYQNSELYRRISRQQVYIGSVRTEPNQEKPLLTVAVPIVDDFRVYGAIIAQLDLSFLQKLVDSRQLGQTGATYLVDRRSKVVFSQSNEPIPAASELLLPSDMRTNTGRPAFRIGEGINAPLALTTYAPLKISEKIFDLSLIIEVPVKEAYAPIFRKLALLVGGSVLVMVGAVLAGVYLARRLMQPLQQLTTTAAHIADGELGWQASAGGTAEVSRLAEAFNRMTARLRNSIQSLEEQVAERTQKLTDANRHLQQEIGDRQQIEIDLRHSQAKLARIFSFSPGPIGIATLDGRYVEVNESFSTLLGYTRSEIIGRTSVELEIWESDKERQQFVRQLQEKKKITNREVNVRTKLGQRKTVLFSMELIELDNQLCTLGVAVDITKRKRLEEDLKQSEERWQLALQGTNDGIWDWNIARNQIFYSIQWKNMLGYVEHEFANCKSEWESRLHPEDRERVLQATQAHLRRETLFYAEEYRLRCKDGNYKWILDRGQALWDEAGNPTRMVGSHADITERKQAEATIHQQEQFLRSVYEGVEAGIFIVDVLGERQFRYAGSNATHERMSGIDRAALLDATPETLLEPETAAAVMKQYQACIDSRERLTYEERLLIHNRVTWWLTTLTPLQDSQGRIFRLLGTTLDLSERKAAEEALARQFHRQQLLSSITNQIRQSLDIQAIYQTTVAEIGRAFNVSRCSLHVLVEPSNPNILTAAEYLVSGYASMQQAEVPFNAYAQALLERDWAIATYDIYREFWLKPVLDICEQFQIKSLLTIRTSYRGKPNGIISLHQCDRQRHWSTEDIELIESVAAQVGIAISQATLLEQEHAQRQELAQKNTDLEAARQVAEQANRVKSEFLANMSHELRTPLNAILGFTQIMQRDATLSSEQGTNLDIISNSGHHLLGLINDILDMSKIEAGRIILNKSSFDLYYLLDALKEMMQIKASAKGLQLLVQRSPDVPQYIQTDESKLRQVLVNLLSNAVKFTESGCITVQVSHNQCSATDMCFSVADTGAGIEPEALETIFEPFIQSKTGRQAQSGTGLGLPISRKFVQLMGGDLSVSSTPGQGSVFSFTIQIAPAQSVAHAQRPRRVVGIAPHQPYRILVVEDTWESRKLLVKLLEPLGFAVKEATNGEEAIAIWESWQPHLVWMDMRMPVMDGYEATRRIKAHLRGQATAIIALTASALEQERAVVLLAGCDDFVRKPFREEELFAKMSEHLGVQYLYEEPSPVPTAEPSSGDWQAIEQMPTEWRSQLQQAATTADSEWLLQLIQQIPPEHQLLASALTDLVHNFRFDRVMELADLVS